MSGTAAASSAVRKNAPNPPADSSSKPRSTDVTTDVLSPSSTPMADPKTLDLKPDKKSNPGDPQGRTTPEIMPLQLQASLGYTSTPVQMFFAALIFINFFVSAGKACIKPQPHKNDGTTAGQVFDVVEWCFLILFSVELLWNMYGFWFFEFFLSGWNWFDLTIVIISWLSRLDQLTGNLSVLRLFRAFRVFRLFKRIHSLRMIIEGVMASLPGVGHAFMVLAILMSIWSIMGVQLFGKSPYNEDVQIQEYFGDFWRGFLTMFQVMTMDSWASGIARVIIYPGGEPGLTPEGIQAMIFFMSFLFIAGIVMMNVVVAILLDKYLSVTQKDEKEAEAEIENMQRMHLEETQARVINNLSQINRQIDDFSVKYKCAFGNAANIVITDLDNSNNGAK